MSAADFDIVRWETVGDVWPRLRRAIEVERGRRIADLLYVATLEGMRQQQGFIEALDWILAEAQPKPETREENG